MSDKKLSITPKTKVGELLDAFPELENILLELSPSFAKLKNPILRKTVARVASLQQAAIVGGLKVDELVNRLRAEVGQNNIGTITENEDYLSIASPEWFNEDKIIRRFDASPIINSGSSPMAEIMDITHKLQPAEILELKTPFIPAPIIDKLKEKDFKLFSLEKKGIILTYIMCK